MGDAEVKIRTQKKGKRILLSWKPKAWEKPSTLQVSLFCPRNTKGKTNIRFHQEKLKNANVREQMRKHWKGVLEKLADELK